MVDQEDFKSAVEFLTTINMSYIPSKNTLQLLIFKVLMKCTDTRVLAQTHIYICNLLEVFPPTEENQLKYYYDALVGVSDLDNSSNSELWTVFSCIVNSCLCHFKVYVTNNEDKEKLIPFPSCTFLLDYYIKILEKNFNSFLDKRSIYADSLKCFLVMLFWPKSEIVNFNSNCIALLKWINDVFKSPVALQKNSMTEKLHVVLSLIVKYYVHRKCGSTDNIAFNSHVLNKMVSHIMVNCKDAFTKLGTFKLFIQLTMPKYLQAKLCEAKIVEMLYKSYNPALTPLTLEKIVLYYMFCFYTKTKKMRSFRKVNGAKGKKSMRVAYKKTARGGTELHELVRENKFADLMECLTETPKHVNAKNNSGNTPLHEACLEQHIMCVRVLLSESGKGVIPLLDIKSANAEGHTPLHISVLMDDVSSAEEILQFGGAELLSISDARGKTPKDLIASDEMKDLFSGYTPITDENISVLDNFEPPKFSSYTEYSIYLYALSILLSHYIDIFHLSDYIQCRDRNTFSILSHESLKCCHASSEHSVCSEDVSMLNKLISYINNFVDKIVKNAIESELHIKLEAMPLQLLAASLIVPEKDINE